jgi:hypothetical protein
MSYLRVKGTCTAAYAQAWFDLFMRIMKNGFAAVVKVW